MALRRHKATRSVPLVFVEGDPEETRRVRTLLPYATFTDWKGASAALALDDLPNGARVGRKPDEAPDVLLLFVRSEAALEEGFPEASAALADGGKFWICWPKKAPGVESDLSQTVVRAFGLAHGFVDYKIASIDATWSGLCFARRGGKRGAKRRGFPIRRRCK